MKRILQHIGKIEMFLFFLLVVWIPFGARKFIYSFTPGFDEYEAIFLYASDFIILGLLILLVFRLKTSFFRVIPRALWVFIALAGLSILWAFNVPLATYSFFRLALMVCLFAITAHMTLGTRIFDTVLGIIAASAIFQAFVGIGQFFMQKSVGFQLLGESYLGPGAQGVAKISTEYGRLLRAYGTMPHANIYASFLVLGFIATMYFWLRRNTRFCAWTSLRHLTVDIVLGSSLFIILMGLILSFSRSGWISAAVAGTVFIGVSLISQAHRFEALRLIIILLVALLLLYNLFSFAILPRIEMTTTSDYAISARLTYNQLGVQLIAQKPLGIGIGNQVLYSVKNGLYKAASMTNRWEWQPIHNIYLLIATELGIAGLLLFGLLLIALFTRPKGGVRKFTLELFVISSRYILVEKIRASLRSFHVAPPFRFITAATLSISLLIFGLSDHFLWDLQPGRLMLWFVFGLLFASHSYGSPKTLQ